MRKKKRLQKLGFGKAAICLGPTLVLFSLFFFIPVLMGFYYSFTNWNAVGSYSFVGFDNYVKLFTEDTLFKNSLARTFLFTAGSVICSTIIAMLCALALTNRFKGNPFIRTILFLPNLISMVICGFIWSFMFTKVYGSMYQVIPLDIFKISWLGDEKYVLIALIIVSIWQGMGYYMTIYIAGLLSIDDSYIEAAHIDGATNSQVFWKIKLPLTLPVISVGAFMNFAFCMKCFDIVFSLTKGGPGNASEVTVLNIYREAFVYNNFGYGCAKAIFFALILVAVGLVQQSVSRKNSL